MNLRVLNLPILLLLSFITMAQPRLIISKIDTDRKVVIEKGNEVTIEIISATGKTEWWGRKTGRIKEITDSTIVLKSIFAKSKVIRLEEIGKIRKMYLLRKLLGVAVSASAVYFFATGSPDIVVMFLFPVALLSTLYDAAISPMKRVDERIWRGNNKWNISVTALEL